MKIRFMKKGGKNEHGFKTRKIPSYCKQEFQFQRESRAPESWMFVGSSKSVRFAENWHKRECDH